MVLNQLSEFKNPSEYNSVLISKQNNLISNGLLVGHYKGFFFFPFSYDLCPSFISSRTIQIHTQHSCEEVQKVKFPCGHGHVTSHL